MWKEETQQYCFWYLLFLCSFSHSFLLMRLLIYHPSILIKYYSFNISKFPIYVFGIPLYVVTFISSFHALLHEPSLHFSISHLQYIIYQSINSASSLFETRLVFPVYLSSHLSGPRTLLTPWLIFASTFLFPLSTAMSRVHISQKANVWTVDGYDDVNELW